MNSPTPASENETNHTNEGSTCSAIAECADSLMRAEALLGAMAQFTEPNLPDNPARLRELWRITQDELADAKAALYRYHEISTGAEFPKDAFRDAESEVVMLMAQVEFLATTDWVVSGHAAVCEHVLRLLMDNAHDAVCTLCARVHDRNALQRVPAH